ncbi:hypothetical protein C8F04DRAFT_1403654 [Mycena alexandri]|uniref:Uncharacterized protein n=1 Tax=Mycena alexandri TaxID=1745969 RepID=A0AAD6WQY4_9AGAR|nr:hypothetical protein C8F04DRAFT_1403654 [Mycena alexandri]
MLFPPSQSLKIFALMFLSPGNLSISASRTPPAACSPNDDNGAGVDRDVPSCGACPSKSHACPCLEAVASFLSFFSLCSLFFILHCMDVQRRWGSSAVGVPPYRSCGRTLRVVALPMMCWCAIGTAEMGAERSVRGLWREDLPVRPHALYYAGARLWMAQGRLVMGAMVLPAVLYGCSRDVSGPGAYLVATFFFDPAGLQGEVRGATGAHMWSGRLVGSLCLCFSDDRFLAAPRRG